MVSIKRAQLDVLPVHGKNPIHTKEIDPASSGLLLNVQEQLKQYEVEEDQLQAEDLRRQQELDQHEENGNQLQQKIMWLLKKLENIGIKLNTVSADILCIGRDAAESNRRTQIGTNFS